MNAIDRILTTREPFGPIDATLVDEAIRAGIDGAEELFDRSNLIYAQIVDHRRPTYIIGRKGAGKTAFLLSSTLRGAPTEVLRTPTIYHEMAAVLERYLRMRGKLFVEQIADIWSATFEQVAVFHAWRTASRSDSPGELQVLWDYLGPPEEVPGDATAVAERFLADLQRRIADESLHGLRELLEGNRTGRPDRHRVRKAMSAVLEARAQPLLVVMDNLEDLQANLVELKGVLAGLFASVGRVIAQHAEDRPYGLQICLPSELFDQIHAISEAPQKDFRGSHLTIYWTAKELLKLSGARLRLYLQAHHSDRLDGLLRRADSNGEAEPAIALLRAALPDTVINGLGGTEDSLAYILRHTQLLPRHLIEILNSVFTVRGNGSHPWSVQPAAVLAGTRAAERIIVQDILAAHRAPYPHAGDVLRRLSGRLAICFPANELHKIFNQQGIRKLSGMDFDEFLAMLFSLGVLGVRFDKTSRYNKAHFQYTFDSSLNAEEDSDYLCLHPLFTRHLYERSLSAPRNGNVVATYPHGCDPADHDYRVYLGYPRA